MKQWLVCLVATAAIIPGCRKSLSNNDAPHPRVVSFSPAITEMIFDMALGDHVVGVTTHDILPAGQRRAVLGDRLNVDAEAILAVEPDVLLIQQNAADFKAIRQINANIRIEHFRIETLKDISAAIRRLGPILGAQRVATESSRRFESKLDAIRRKVAGLTRPRVLFVIDYERPWAAGAGTFIDEMIQLAGGVNAAGDRPRYPAMDSEAILTAAPDVLICQVEQFRRAAAQQHWKTDNFADLPAAMTGRVFVVTDRHWSIPSARVADMASKLVEMIHPELAAKGRQE